MQAPSHLVVASKNPDKIKEVEQVLARLDLPSVVVRGRTWPPVPETAETLEGNALLKARAVVGHTGLAALADDTGLEVDAIGGAPGVRTARFAGPDATYEDNVALLLDVLGDSPARSARFRTAVAVVTTHGEELVAVGTLEGRITERPRGESGFGYDPVFEVDGVTLAEMEDGVKNTISHRARALEALVSTLT